MKLLGKQIGTPLFYYQIFGGVGVFLKLYGRIDPIRLLEYAGVDPEGDEAKRVIDAAGTLEDICIQSALLADDTGVGKTKTWLLLR